MKNKFIAVGLIVLNGFLLTGCDQTSGMLGGGAMGTAAGAGIGYAIDGGAGGAILGGVIGGLLGGAVGSEAGKQEEEAQCAAPAQKPAPKKVVSSRPRTVTTTYTTETVCQPAPVVYYEEHYVEPVQCVVEPVVCYERPAVVTETVCYEEPVRVMQPAPRRCVTTQQTTCRTVCR